MTRFEILLKKPVPVVPIVIEPMPKLSKETQEFMMNMARDQVARDTLQWRLDGDRTRNFHVLREIPRDMSTQDRVRLRMSMTSELVLHAMREKCFNITFSENLNHVNQTITLEGELRV